MDAGFHIESQVITPEECDELLTALDQADIERSRAGARHLMRLPCVQTIANDQRLVRLAIKALGNDAVPFRATLFDKSPAANWLVAWHQDTALPLRERFEGGEWGPWSNKAGVLYTHAPAWALERVAALRLHLDACTLENGPLRVLPGTHTLGVLEEEEVAALSHEQAVSCLSPRGGALLMSPLIVHASSKVHSDLPRRVLHLEYAATLTLGQGIELAVV